MSSTQCAAAPPHGWRLFLVFVGFAGLVCLYTYPLILHPGTYLRTHGDPFMFTWALNRVVEGLFTDPLGLFETNIFYPYGKTLAYSEPLLVPAAVTAAPVYLLSGNPILAYNVTLLAFQALSGFSAYYAARSLTGSEAGGWLVGIAYALCAFKTGYYNFLTIHLSFAVPLAFLYLIRFFEQQRPRDLWRVVGLVWLQTVTIWYGGIPLVALLLVATLGFLLLRPGGWKPRSFVWMLAAGVVLILALLPIALPYMQVRAELGLERSLETVVTFRADLMSYLDAGQDNRVYDLVRSGRYPGLFPGFTVYLLAAVAFLHLRQRGAVARAPRWLIRTLAALAGLAAAAVAAFVFTGGRPLAWSGGELPVPPLAFTTLALLGLGVTALALGGWVWARTGGHRALSASDGVLLLAPLSWLFMLLPLGPVMTWFGQPAGTGLYAYAYEIFPLFRALRISLRMAFVPMFLLGLLAAYGLLWVRQHLTGRWRVLVWLAPVVLAVEYVSFPLEYGRIEWSRPPPVYDWLARQPGDLAILELPTDNEAIDTYYMLWSLHHGKRKVSGNSGFFPPFTHEVVEAASQLRAGKSTSALRRIYPLRYLIVHLDLIFDRGVARRFTRWRRRPPKGLRFVEDFDGKLVFEFAQLPERGASWERTFSTDLVSAKPRALISAAAGTPGGTSRVEVSFNGRVIDRPTLSDAVTEIKLLLQPPYPKAQRNILRITADESAPFTVSGFRLSE